MEEFKDIEIIKIDLKEATEKEQILLDKTENEIDLNVDFKMPDYKKNMPHWIYK